MNQNHGPTCNGQEEYWSDPKTHEKYKEIISTTPQRKGIWVADLHQHEGFWWSAYSLKGVLWAQDHFMPQPNNVILSSAPKSGTTRLKALSFAVMTRSHFDEPASPLLTRLAHDCVPFLESEVRSNPQNLDLDVPLLATHIPYTSLPKSIIDSGCKIVYICRDPKDVFVSLWHFLRKMNPKAMDASALEDLHLEDAFEFFCEGFSSFGPYWDHVLGYWRASLESPEKVLFLKYEDLKNDTISWVKKLAQFMGYPFSSDEEQKGMVHKIVNLCSFENLSSLEVNKSGITQVGTNFLSLKNSSFFRKGEVGDWKNHLILEMAMRLDQITEQKLKGSGLTFHFSSNA